MARPAVDKKAEGYYRAIFDSVSDAIVMVRFDGTIIEGNRSAAELLGFTIEELVGKNISELLTPEIYARLMAEQRAYLAGASIPRSVEFEFRRSDGRRLIVESAPYPIIVDGKVVGVQAIIRDLTERKRLERKLEEREKTFRAMAEQSGDGILVARPNAEYVYANRSASQITGYSEAELLGMKVADLVHPGEMPQLAARNREKRQGKHPVRQYESVFVRKDGRAIPVEVVEARAQWHGQTAIWMTFRDIAEQVRLRDYASGVTRAQEEERRRVARELHDDTIQTLAALALEIQELGRDEDTCAKCRIKLEELRCKTNDIADGVRRFTYELRPAVLDRLGLIAALEALTAELNQQAEINAHLEVSGGERRLAPDLEVALFRIAQEALANVRKHARAKKTVMKVEFKRSRLRLTISDNGRGCDLPDNIADFVSAGKLGLAGIQERARLFGGQLSLSSRVGKGTTLTVAIPV